MDWIGRRALTCHCRAFFVALIEKADEPPAKLLDDLFLKTKAAPCIYWLPLTEEQVGVLLPVFADMVWV